VLVAVAVSGCGSADTSKAPAEKRAFAFSGKTLTINAGNAEVELVPADIKTVEVTRRVAGGVFVGSGPDPVWKMSDGTLTLKVKCSALADNCTSDNRVKVPRGVAVTVNGDNGRVTASGFSTTLKIVSDNGSVTVKDSSGPLNLTSDNGSITTERTSGASVSAHSDNGSVRLGLTAVPDLVDTVSDNGRITIELPSSPKTAYAVTAKADGGDAHVEVPTDDHSAHVVKAHSDDGEITVRIAN
jgi:hypothetical protein